METATRAGLALLQPVGRSTTRGTRDRCGVAFPEMSQLDRLLRRRPDSSPVPQRGELAGFTRRIALLGGVVAGLLALGTVGLALTEGVGAWSAFRWSLDTIATLGGFAQPHTVGGQ